MLPTRQDAAIVVCGGGDPLGELEVAKALCKLAHKPYTLFAGNDQIGNLPDEIEHAATLHPDKLTMWTGKRITNGWPAAKHTWAHRPFSGISDWTRDWSGSTGLFCVKIARELGFVHIILCGVHMDADSGHFLRKQRWDACSQFIRAWEMRDAMLKPYVRSLGGWTRERFMPPTREWLRLEIEDRHRQPAPPTFNPNAGMKA
jgi:hypothetical protein